MEDLRFAPGCFGSIIAFSSEDGVCSHCPFAEQCESAHEERKRKLQATYGIKVPVKQRKQQAVDPVTGEPVMTLSLKAQALLEKLDKSSLDICGNLQRGINPFNKNAPKYLKLLCHLMLINQRPVPNHYLVAAFMQEFNWKQDTAKTHVRIACQALEHVGAIALVDGTIRIKQQEQI